MSIPEEILKFINQGMTEWNEIYNILQEKYSKNSISMAKSRLLKAKKIIEEEVNGIKILSINIQKEEELISDVDAYIFEHSNEIKEYFKHCITKNSDNRTFEIKEFCMNFPHLMEINDIIINNPFEARNKLTELYSETYSEQYDNEPELPISISCPIGRTKQPHRILKDDLNKLVEFECSIVQASKPKLRTQKAELICMQCGTKTIIELGMWDDYLKISKKMSCSNINCNAEGMAVNKRELSNIQEVIVQSLGDYSNGGDQLRTIFIEDMEQIYSGKIRVCAIPIEKHGKNGTSDIFFYATYYELIDDYHVEIDEEDINNIKKVAEDRQVIEKISQVMFNRIHGNELVKKIVFLQQIKGTKKEVDRHNINILLISDPGAGKTTLMDQLREYENVSYVNGTTATAPGITGAVIKRATEFGENWIIKPGAIPQADGGTICIDEFTANKSLHTTLLEPLESQRVHIDKAGINTYLPAECATLAACNPRWGKFDPDKSVMEQIDILPQVLDRFDLVIPLKGQSQKKEFIDLAKFIIKSGNNDVKGVKEKIEIKGVEISKEFMQKYIAYAKELRPTINEEAGDIIANAFYELNKKANFSTRQLKATIRIAEAIAKAKLKEEVEAEDAKEALDIVVKCLELTAYDPEKGFDVDKIFGVPAEKRDKLDTVLNIIKECAETRENDIVPEEEIYEIAESYGIDADDLESLLELLKKRGEICSPRFGYWRIT